MKYFAILISLIFIFSSCSKENTSDGFKISTNSWIGYAPLFYANEKGYLQKLNIQLFMNVSLAEASEIYNIGKAQMVTTTQHEFYTLKNSFPSLTPVILLDRSNGGDMILSNKKIEELKKAEKIYAYLEIDSINAELLKTFIKKNKLDIKKIEFIDQDQAKIQDVSFTKKKAILIVTYTPYDVTLKKKGFQEIASTKDLNSLVVIDALCTTKEFLKQNRNKIEKLKNVLDKSILEIQKNPKESYHILKGYLGEMSYEEFLNSLNTIKWINNPSNELFEIIEKIGYKKEYIIK